jgi:uncharacterized protein (TIGR02266 family)
MEHRRADRRYDRQLTVELVYEGRRHQGRSLNISLGGMFLVAGVALPYGARVELKFSVPTQREAIEVNAQVRWSNETGDPAGLAAGLRFEGLRARDVWALNKFFERPAE